MKIDKKLRNVLLTVLIAVAVFAYFDQTPSFLSSREQVFSSLWIFSIALISWVYFIFRRDLSESLGIFLVGVISLYSGMEDYLFFFIYNIQGRAVDFCVNHSLDKLYLYSIADTYLLHNTCVTFAGLFLNVLIGIVISVLVMLYLIRQKW